MIKIRDFTSQIEKDMEIKITYRDRLINRNYIECVQKSINGKNFYAADIKGAGYCYEGYIIDNEDKIVKDLDEVRKIIK